MDLSTVEMAKAGCYDIIHLRFGGYKCTVEYNVYRDGTTVVHVKDLSIVSYFYDWFGALPQDSNFIPKYGSDYNRNYHRYNLLYDEVLYDSVLAEYNKRNG